MPGSARAWNARRRTLAVAAALVLFTPILAWALLRDNGRESLTSQATGGPNDVAAAQAILERMRGTSAFACELALINVDHHNWFGGLSNQISDSPLIDDSTQVALPAELAAPQALQLLLRGLRDTDACVRRASASLLGRTTAPSTLEQLRAILDDSEAQTRALAAFALGLREPPAASDRLLSLLSDASPVVRATAAWALGRLEYKPAIPRLAELLERDSNARVRRAAARALGEIAS
jgi:hypothetical protein